VVHLLLRNQLQQHLLSLQQPGVPVLLHLPVPGVWLLPVPTQELA
jgi:hypothetical protein